MQTHKAARVINLSWRRSIDLVPALAWTRDRSTPSSCPRSSMSPEDEPGVDPARSLVLHEVLSAIAARSFSWLACACGSLGPPFGARYAHGQRHGVHDGRDHGEERALD